MKLTRPYAKTTHNGLKSRIDFLKTEVSEPELLANLDQYAVELAVRFEDWTANELGTEYFVKKLKETTEKVEMVAKQHGMVAEAESKARQAEAEANALLEAQEKEIASSNASSAVIVIEDSEPTQQPQDPVNMDVGDSDNEEEEESDVPLPIPFTFIRRHDQSSQKVYYEHSKDKSTTWALPEGKNEWVDLSMLLFKLPGEKSHTPKDIENLFDGRSDVEVNTASMTIEKHVLVEFASEQDAWNALLFLNIAQKTPELTYSLANQWLQTKFDYNVRFLNHQDSIGTFSLTFCPPFSNPFYQDFPSPFLKILFPLLFCLFPTHCVSVREFRSEDIGIPHHTQELSAPA